MPMLVGKRVRFGTDVYHGQTINNVMPDRLRWQIPFGSWEWYVVKPADPASAHKDHDYIVVDCYGKR